MFNSKIEMHAKNNKYNDEFYFKQLKELEQETDWDDLVKAIFPCYVKSKIEPILLTVESMLRIYILERLFDMSPSSVKKALLQVDTFKEFALIDLDRDAIPSESCIANFNSLLVAKNLAPKIDRVLSMKSSEVECSAAF